MRRIGKLAFLVIAVAAVTTVGFVDAIKPSNATAFLAFSAWLVSPHAVMAATLGVLERRGAAAARWYVVAITVCIVGILFLADVIFWQPDPQGALAVLMAPLFQAIASALLLALARLLGRASSAPPSRP